MLFEETLLLVGIPLILILVGYLAHRAELTVIGGVGLIVVGVMILASPLVVHYNVNYTAEQSYVWNGYCNVTDLFLTEYNAYVVNYSMENGVLTAGNIASTYFKDGNYLQIKENGAGFNITYNFTAPVAACPTHMRFSGRYQGPANRQFEWWAYNWTSASFVNLGFAAVASSSSDATFTYACPISSTFQNTETGEILIKMVTTNAAAGAYYIYTDELLVYVDSLTDYSVQTQLVACTRDNYNITYWYDGEELDPNNNMIIGVLIALLGLLCLVVGTLSFRD